MHARAQGRSGVEVEGLVTGTGAGETRAEGRCRVTVGMVC